MPVVVSPGFVGKRPLLIEGVFCCFKAVYGYLFVAPTQPIGIFCCLQATRVMDPNQSRRTWSTTTRDPWNAPIHHILKAIDCHVSLFIETGDVWHIEKAEDLRLYLHELKTYIHKKEGRY